MTGEEKAREIEAIESAIRATEYKYFGDYEMSDDQREAVDQLVLTAQHRLAALQGPSSGEGAKCFATRSIGANDPQDCDWPMCGCDPAANKVIAALEESGFSIGRNPATPAAAPGGDERHYTPEALSAHAIDFLDRKADEWMMETGVARMVQSAASVFDKRAEPDILQRFNETLEAIMHQTFVEGAFRTWAEIEQERATLSPPSDPDVWQPIETAPKDGERFLGLTPWGIEVVKWHPGSPGMLALAEGWVGTEQDSTCLPERLYALPRPAQCQPTHWHPLPAPPARTGKGA